MKKFRWLFLFLVIAGMGSCTMEKRLYRKGFYVDRIKTEIKSNEKSSQEFVASPSQTTTVSNTQASEKENVPVSQFRHEDTKVRRNEKPGIQIQQPIKPKTPGVKTLREKVIPNTRKFSGSTHPKAPSVQQPILFGFAFLGIGALVLIFNPEGIVLALILLGISALLFLFALILWILSSTKSTQYYS